MHLQRTGNLFEADIGLFYFQAVLLCFFILPHNGLQTKDEGKQNKISEDAQQHP
jgi:hypothetical protein